MCEERIAPHAAEVDRDAAFPWDGFKAWVEMELPALGIPVAYGGAGADHVTQAIMVEELARVCASTSVTMLISKLGMMPDHQLGDRGAEADVRPACGIGRGPGQLLPVGGRRRQRRGGHAVPGGARRRPLRAVGDQVLDHQRRRVRHLHRLRQDRPRRRATGASAASWSRPTGASRWPSSSTRWGCAAARRGRSSSTTCGSRSRTGSGEEGQGFTIAMHTLDRSRPTIGAQAVGIAQGAHRLRRRST